MPTLVIKTNSAQSRQFLEYARTLPYVDVVDESYAPQRRFKPEVEETLRKAERGEDLIVCKDAEDMFRQWGLR